MEALVAWGLKQLLTFAEWYSLPLVTGCNVSLISTSARQIQKLLIKNDASAAAEWRAVHRTVTHSAPRACLRSVSDVTKQMYKGIGPTPKGDLMSR